MRGITIFLYEWKHFLRSPFKWIAVILFVVAAIYGLHNGSNLYHQQMKEVEKLEQKVEEDKQKYIAKYEAGELTPEDRPWIDMSSAFWAIWYSPKYHIKVPTAAMVYNIGQAEQYGFYKRVTFWSSPYDADMAEEIANPERLQKGTLDFSFVLLFLLPLLLLILVYNLKSSEAEQGILSLIEVQTASKHIWITSRMLFYIVLCALLLFLLLGYGAELTGVFEIESHLFRQLLVYTMIYLLLWGVAYYFIVRIGKNVLGNILKMIGVWLLFAFIIPATVHQVVSIEKPANLMTDFIEVRDQEQELYKGPDSIFQQKLVQLFPQIANSPVYQDSTKVDGARNSSASALSNELNKNSIQPILTESQEKNNMIQATFWFNPLSFFQNKLNRITKTHYDDYANYRNEIQELIDLRIESLIDGLWNDIKVDKEKYIEYTENL